MKLNEWVKKADIPLELLDKFCSMYLLNFNQYITEVNQSYDEWWIDFNLLLPCI